MRPVREEIRKIQQLMEAAEYVTDAPVATSVHLALSLRKPLLIEGHAGVGKTEVAKVMSRVLGTNLIRLQCYEGLDASTALYEWNYQKQLLHIKLTEASARPVDDKEHEIFSESFLLRRPLLQAITQESQSPVLLVDEVDRCVAADTLIATERGVTRAENVRPGDELISFDPDTFRLTRATVRKVIPRETTRIVRILAAGRFLEVTPEHRFVRFTEGGHEVVHASDLTPGDHLPISSGSRRVTVDEPEFDFDDDIVKLAETQRRRLHAAYRASGRRYEDLAVDIGVSRSHLRNVLQPQACRRSLRAAPLAKLVSVLDLPGPDTARLTKRIRQSVGFYEVLGYIVADGCFTSDRLCVSD
ncbi:MAG: AAA family ATPase, partial [Candidatus Rokubacteria bacterium]|nr:AAA family ATPase [Candidatus Rokubacteria bacterium]